MKKRILRSLGAIILSAALYMGMTAAAEIIEPMEDNSIEFSVKPEYRDEVLANPEGAFADLHPAGVYITGVNKEDGGGMDILLVLSERGDQARQEAIETLSDDIRVSYVRQYTDAPFEDVNTLSLSADTNTIHVGEKVAIRQDGEIRIYSSLYNWRSLEVILKDCDPDKEYMVEDFPQLPLKEVKKIERHFHGESDGALIPVYTYYVFNLVLDEEHWDYFSFICAADILARSSDISDVCLKPITGMIRWSEFCTVSDSSVAQFTNTKTDEYADGELVGVANEDNEYILEGLKPGKATVTYYHYGYHGSPNIAQMEITVLDNEPQSSDVSDTPQSDSRESGYSQSNNPKTGDASPTAAAGLFVLAGGSGLWIVLRRKRI